MTYKAIRNRLQKYFDAHWPNDADTAEWYVDPAPNQWRFVLRCETITLTCDENGHVSEDRKPARK